MTPQTRSAARKAKQKNSTSGNSKSAALDGRKLVATEDNEGEVKKEPSGSSSAASSKSRTAQIATTTTTATKSKKPAQVSPFIVLVGIATMLLILRMLLSGNRSSRIRHPRRYLNLASDWPEFNVEAKEKLEQFQGDLLYDEALGSIRHAKVLQIEGTEANRDRLESIIEATFPREQFDKLIIDGSTGDRLNEDFFVRFDDERPLLVVLRNAHRASRDVLLSFSAKMSDSLLTHDSRARSPHNVGFLISGFSLPLRKESCNRVDLLQHDLETLKWVGTFVTRLTENAKVC